MELEKEYDQATNEFALFDVQRSRVRLVGSDRLKVANNFCTADLNKVDSGSGTEAFILNLKGKIVAHVGVYVSDSEIYFDCEAGNAAPIIKHIDQYVISEDVELIDDSDQIGCIFITGPASKEKLEQVDLARLPAKMHEHGWFRNKQHSWHIIRTDMLGPAGFLISTDLSASFCLDGYSPASLDVLEVLRVENGMPLYGRDLTDKNLAQEAQRDNQAISFTKGCYLGQETVARLDALGHVNKMLAGVAFEGDSIPESGFTIECEGKGIAKINSSVYSFALQKPLAIAMVRSGFHEVGTEMGSEIGTATIVEFPSPNR